MAVIEIEAKTILASVHQPEAVFGLRYNMNLYRGCQHQCIYCDSRSLCYGIENFSDILVKINALDLLEKELPRKRVKGTIGTGSMNDPYMPIEQQYQLTRRALGLIARYGFGVHVITKSDLVVRDADLLLQINRVHAAVSFSISTAADDLAKKVEPGAPPTSARLRALRTLASQGIPVGVCMMPILPFLEDTIENITAIVEQAAANGARYIVPWFGMSMRDRQRDHFYAQLDRLFPGLRGQYERAFGEHYDCPIKDARRLADVFHNLCLRLGLENHAPVYDPRRGSEQLSLF